MSTKPTFSCFCVPRPNSPVGENDATATGTSIAARNFFVFIFCFSESLRILSFAFQKLRFENGPTWSDEPRETKALFAPPRVRRDFAGPRLLCFFDWARVTRHVDPRILRQMPRVSGASGTPSRR